MIRYLIIICGIAQLIACSQLTQSKMDVLPIIGQYTIEGQDTIYQRIPDFSFTNQENEIVTNETFAEGIYVADFFFTSCPTICPVVKKQMLRIHEAFEGETKLKFLSHSIDARRDSVAVLHKYSKKLGVGTPKWHFVTGDQDRIFDIAEDYLSVAFEDENEPGGFNHSGRLILIDPQRHIRAFCNGTDPEDVTDFIEDIKRLLTELNTLPG